MGIREWGRKRVDENLAFRRRTWERYERVGTGDQEREGRNEIIGFTFEPIRYFLQIRCSIIRYGGLK